MNLLKKLTHVLNIGKSKKKRSRRQKRSKRARKSKTNKMGGSWWKKGALGKALVPLTLLALQQNSSKNTKKRSYRRRKYTNRLT